MSFWFSTDDIQNNITGSAYNIQSNATKVVIASLLRTTNNSGITADENLHNIQIGEIFFCARAWWYLYGRIYSMSPPNFQICIFSQNNFQINISKLAFILGSLFFLLRLLQQLILLILLFFFFFLLFLLVLPLLLLPCIVSPSKIEQKLSDLSASLKEIFLFLKDRFTNDYHI